MEDNTNNNLLSLLGFQAYSLNENADSGFQQFINKSLENGKQNVNSDITSMSDMNTSLLNTLNMIDSTIKNESFGVSLQSENTYTLDDLLDFENEDMNAATLFDASLEDDSSFLSITPDMALIETALASPLSSSSEESCDLDDILFLDETPSSESTMEPEVVDEANTKAVQNDHQYTVEATEEPSLLEYLNSNGTDLSAICSLLFQNQSIEAPSEIEEQSIAPSSPFTFSAPSSPASSESECESVRYNPYKKSKTPEQKQRKKAQNRTAANRYRVKKKDELKIMVDEADELEKKNKGLKGKVDGLKSEIDYLKNLMLDVIKARLAKGTSPQNLLSVVMAK
jgi:hypothetical protein